tara:strand:- start:2438 stop:3664 length:1227 start_codon:yes stop_codon:yes gene_type:complete
MCTKILLLSGLFTHFGSGYAIASNIEAYVETLRRHPEVQHFFAQKNRFDEMSEAELALPDPQIYVGIDNMFFDDPGYNRLISPTKSIGFIQNVPSILFRQAKSSKKKILSRHQELSGRYMLKRLEARLVRHVANYKKIKILEGLAEQQLVYYELMEFELKGQLESGRPVYGLFFEVDVDKMEIEQRLNKLEYEMISTEEELKWLVGEVPQIESLKNSNLFWDPKGSSLFPIKIAEEVLKSTHSDLKIAEASSSPNFSIQATYKRREFEQKSRDYDWFNIQASVSVPIWYKKNQEPRLRAARFDKQSATLIYERTCQDWLKQMSILQAAYQNVTKDIQLLKEKKASRKEVTETANRNYEAGLISLTSVLIAQIDELSIESQIQTKRSTQISLSAEFNSHLIGESIDDIN